MCGMGGDELLPDGDQKPCRERQKRRRRGQRVSSEDQDPASAAQSAEVEGGDEEGCSEHDADDIPLDDAEVGADEPSASEPLALNEKAAPLEILPSATDGVAAKAAVVAAKKDRKRKKREAAAATPPTDEDIPAVVEVAKKRRKDAVEEIFVAPSASAVATEGGQRRSPPKSKTGADVRGHSPIVEEAEAVVGLDAEVKRGRGRPKAMGPKQPTTASPCLVDEAAFKVARDNGFFGYEVTCKDIAGLLIANAENMKILVRNSSDHVSCLREPPCLP